jgi:hypothetical protein
MFDGSAGPRFTDMERLPGDMGVTHYQVPLFSLFFPPLLPLSRPPAPPPPLSHVHTTCHTHKLHTRTQGIGSMAGRMHENFKDLLPGKVKKPASSPAVRRYREEDEMWG